MSKYYFIMRIIIIISGIVATLATAIFCFLSGEIAGGILCIVLFPLATWIGVLINGKLAGK